jgi:predicted DNA-binding transcriptional regulator YafY
MSVSRVYRLLRLITMLQSGRSFTPDELALELEISRRTVFRDLNMLELAHIPYHFDADHGGYKISQHFFLPPVNLTLPEALAILMLTGRMTGKHLPLLAQGSRAAMKIESALPPAIRQHVGSIVERMNFSLGPVSRHDGFETIFDQLAQALAQRSVCQLVYFSFQERKQLKVEIHPLRLVFHGRAWYVIAYSTLHREVRTFKLVRIRKLTVTRKVFPPRQEVDPDQYFGDAWSMIPEGKLHDVQLRFANKVAGNVAEVQWHKSQRMQWNPDGTMDFFARVDGLGEISWWILGYGDQVEVISPNELRRTLAGVATSMLQKYQGEDN